MNTSFSLYKIIVFTAISSVYCCSCNPFTERLSGFEVHGIDISHHQEAVEWDTLLTQDIHFAFIKATEGKDYKDSLFSKNWEALENSGILKGAYHFYRPSVSPEIQFHNFSETVLLKPGDLPPVLDIELIGDTDPVQLCEGIKIWLDLAEAHYQVLPVIYTYQKFYNQYLKNDFKDYPLWIARYHTIEPILEDSSQWQFWQYGNRGKLPGIDGFVDFNVFKGNLEELKSLLVKEDSLTSALFSY